MGNVAEDRTLGVPRGLLRFLVLKMLSEKPMAGFEIAEQIEALCLTAENAARKYIFTKVSPKMVAHLDVSVEADGVKPLNLTIEVNLVLSPQAKNVDLDKLVSEAGAAAERT